MPHHRKGGDSGDTLALALAAMGEVERVTHGFHTYAAGLHPDAAARLVAAFPGDSVLDPFVGGGTVLVEGRLAGRRTLGRDVSPVALLVATARTSTADEATLTRMRSVARRLAEDARKARRDPPDRILHAVADWYAPHVLHELEAIRHGIEETEPGHARALLEACFSSILVKVSWRKSDTSQLRVRHDRPAGTAAVLFHKKSRELGRRITALRELVPPATPPSDLALVDARRLAISEPVDLVLTSPPYPSTYDYVPMQHLRTIWLGLPPGEGEIGSRRAFREGHRDARQEWMDDTRAWMSRAVRWLRPGGHLVIVIGDGLTPTGPIDSAAITDEAARDAGFEPFSRASVERPDFARDTMRWEHALAYVSPARTGG
jgi:hypothetical protein